MSESFQKELDAIKSSAPTSVRADPTSLLYGVVFVGLGLWLVDLGDSAMGSAMIVVGALGVVAGGATFVSKSPKVKLLQAADGVLMALLLLGMSAQGGGTELMDNPLVGIGFAAFMLWAAYDDFKEYGQLSEALNEKLRLQAESKGE